MSISLISWADKVRGRRARRMIVMRVDLFIFLNKGANYFFNNVVVTS